MGFTEDALDKMTIFDLRNYARSVGVKSPTSKTKNKLMSEIFAIDHGELEPFFPVKPQGRPRKKMENVMPINVNYDNVIETPFSQLRNAESNDISKLVFSSSTEKDASTLYAQKFKVEGYLSVNAEQNVLYDFSYQTHILKSASMPSEIIEQYGLQKGDYVVANAVNNKGSDYPEIIELISINDNEDFIIPIKNVFENEFEKSTKDLIIAKNENLSGYDIALNLMLPMCMGDKIILVNNDKLFERIKNFLDSMPHDMERIIVLTNAMPNLVAEARSMPQSKLFYCFFGSTTEQQKQIVNLAFDSAQRMCDNGKKVIVLIFNMNEFVDNTLSNEENVVTMYKHVFSRTIKTNSSSLTILANMNESIFAQFKQHFMEFIDVVINLTQCSSEHINLKDSFSNNNNLLPEKIRDLKKVIDCELQFTTDKDSKHVWDIFNINGELEANIEEIFNVEKQNNLKDEVYN